MGVRCEISRLGRLVGSVDVVDGAAVASNDEVARLLGLPASPIRVSYQGQMRGPEDGEAYLRGLPGAFRSGYVSANVVETGSLI
jgi:hypothetical protein